MPNGLNACAVGNVECCGWRIVGESCGRGPAMAVVMACSCVRDDSEVVVGM